jgi:CDP-diacylglycerol--serine O-phosphatidyltransferase
MLTAITVLFLGSIPWSVMRYRQLDRAHAAQAEQPQSAPSEPEPPAA